MKEIFRTHDGQEFESKLVALEHEKKLFKDWLASRPKIDIKLLIDTANDVNDEEFYGTEKCFHIMTARAAFALVMD